MLVDRKQLEEYLTKQMEPIALKSRSGANKIGFAINKKHNIPAGLSMDYITRRKDISEASEFEMFCLLEEINDKKISSFFTGVEIRNYKSCKLEDEKTIDFPIVIKCVQIDQDQYIGKIDVALLMKFREAQLINYNPNSQRTMQRIVRNNKETFKIMLNKSAVSHIKESFKNGNYIPNTITLNIPTDSGDSFYYDDKSSELVIERIKAFDISDGYHRYVAMGEIYDSDNSWDYPMELRITNFNEDKAKTFIFQEDQKTKMRKIDSDSMNMNSSANVVLSRLNTNSLFRMKGMIQRGGGNISLPEFANIINYLYFKNKPKKGIQKLEYEVEQTLCNKMNEMVSLDFEILTHRFTFTELCIMIYGIYIERPSSEIVIAIKKADSLDKRKFSNHQARKKIFDEVASLYAGG